MFKSLDVSIFLATVKAEECLAFYTQVLGLDLREENDFALVFDLKGVELRISKVPTFNTMPFTVLDWQVPDLSSAMDELEERGVKFEHYDQMGMDERNVWSSPDGTKIAWFKDPDGNILSISERVK
ncbi:MAG: glyoxalase [Robiginitomaculum sp.]|nr:MAG: glyoxalase [Robiginitomaculum sp.]